MNQFQLGRLSVPITTGTPPQARPSRQAGTPVSEQNEASSFQAILQQRLAQESGVEFSKHAVNRVVNRSIDVSEDNLERLNEGVRIAQEKGMNETLILIDRTAFIVNVKNNKVITTVNGEELKGNAFTNIDGTVIV